MDTRGLLSMRSVFSFFYMQWLIYFINSLSFKVNAFQFLVFLNAFIREAGRDLCFLLYLLAVYATMCYIFLNGYYVLDCIGHVSNACHGHLLINMVYQFFSSWTRIFSFQFLLEWLGDKYRGSLYPSVSVYVILLLTIFMFLQSMINMFYQVIYF